MDNVLESYILSHIDAEPPLLQSIYRKAHVKLLHPRMVAGHWQGRLLKMLVQMMQAKNVLEIGAFTGYSALCLAEGIAEEGKVHTIEIDDELEEFIRKNIDTSEHKNKIELHVGDALEIVPTFEDNFFDAAFIDGDKRHYWDFFETVLPKVKTNGFLLVDNTLWNNKVLAKPASNDWQTKGIIDFNDRLANDTRVEKVIIPIRDGLTLIRKK